MHTPLAILLLLLLACPLLVRGIPTGLNTIPTAEVIGPTANRLDGEFGASGKLFADRDSHLVGSQQGMEFGIEIGADDVSSRGMVYNAKWQFKGDGLILPAMAAGVQNFGHGEKAQYYLVATKSAPYKLISGTVGILRDSNSDYLTLLGGAVNFGPLFVQADNINGGLHNRSSIGAGFRINKFRVMGTHYYFNDGPNKQSISVSYEFGGL